MRPNLLAAAIAVPLSLLAAQLAHAGEGMWVPQQLPEIAGPLQKAGLKLSPLAFVIKAAAEARLYPQRIAMDNAAHCWACFFSINEASPDIPCAVEEEHPGIL